MNAPAPHLQLVAAAVLKHKPRPTEVITLDLGEFGEHLATVEYEVIPADVRDLGQRVPAHLEISSVTVDRLGDMLDFIKGLHPDGLAGVVAKVEEKLRGAAA